MQESFSDNQIRPATDSHFLDVFWLRQGEGSEKPSVGFSSSSCEMGIVVEDRGEESG